MARDPSPDDLIDDMRRTAVLMLRCPRCGTVYRFNPGEPRDVEIECRWCGLVVVMERETMRKAMHAAIHAAIQEASSA